MDSEKMSENSITQGLSNIVNLLGIVEGKLRERVEEGPWDVLAMTLYGMVVGLGTLAGNLVAEWGFFVERYRNRKQEVLRLHEQIEDMHKQIEDMRGSILRLQSKLLDRVEMFAKARDLDEKVKFLAAVMPSKINAIKLARETHGIGLADAKNFVEAWCMTEAFERFPKAEAVKFLDEFKRENIGRPNVEFAAAEEWAERRKTPEPLPLSTAH